MTEYIVGFEEEFRRDVYERRRPDAMNMHEADELQVQAIRASVEVLTTLGYVAQFNLKGIIEVDKSIDPEDFQKIRKMFDEFRIIAWNGEDTGAAPLVIRERRLEKLVEMQPSK